MQPLINMDTSDDKNILMRKLAIYEFGCRRILYLMFELESLSIYCPYQKRFAETICYFESKAKHPIEKFKLEEEKAIKKEV